MAKKTKKRMHRMPPLSFADKLIYWMSMLLLCVAYLLLLFGPLYLRRQIAFADGTVLAAEDNISTWWMAVPWFTFFVITFGLWVHFYQDRRPIFGKRNFRYGPPAWPRVYPLFMKNKPYVFVSERKRKQQKQTARIMLAVLLISMIPLPWSLYGRDCLRDDGSIVQYNMLNVKTREFAPEDVTELTIETFRYGTGRHYRRTSWGVRMIFTTASGRKYVFDHREFRDDGQTGPLHWLEAMRNIKNRYNPAIICYDGVEKLESVIGGNWTEEEAKMLYRLFGQG